MSKAFSVSLSEATLNLFEHDEAVITGNLCAVLFAIRAKDSIDKNSKCTISKSHYHGTNLSLFQFPSTAKRDIMRKNREEERYEKYVKEKGETITFLLHRRNKADIAPHFNSILPLLRLNVADFGTQKHCIEIVDSATTLLNPG